MNIAILILVIVCAVILAWNFYPPFRERMRGWSTIAEGAIGTGMYYFGIISDGIKEGQDAGYIPENLTQYVPFVLLAWVIVKRLQTTTPIGGK